MARFYFFWAVAAVLFLRGLSVEGFSYAGERLMCPAPQPEYSSLLARLESLKNGLENSQECRNLATELEDLSLFRKGEIWDLGSSVVEGIQKRVINPDQLKEVSQYARDASSKILRIIESFQQNPSCVGETKQPGFLATLATLAQQTTSLASSYAGPYGIALSVGGSIFSSVLLAFDEILKSKNYDFSDPSKRQVYMTSVCMYHDIRQEIMDTINPTERLQTLDSILALLNEKEQLIRSHCQDCDLFFKVWDFSARSDHLLRALEDKIHQIESEFSREPYRQCVDLSSLFHSNESPLTNLMKELRSTLVLDGEPTSLLVADVLWHYDIGVSEIVPSRETCWSESLDELGELNARSLSLVKVVVNRTNLFLATTIAGAMGGLEEQNQEENFPLKLAKTFAIRAWVESEQRVLRRLQEAGSNESRGEINRRRQYLTQRLFEELSPQFLRYQISMALEGRRNLDSRLKATRREFWGLVGQKEYSDPIDVSRALEEISYGRPETERHQMTKKAKAHTRIYALAYDYLAYLDRIDFAVETISEYCLYFEKSGTEFPEIMAVCQGPEVKSVRQMSSNLSGLKSAILIYVDWCHSEGYVRADSARDLRRQIEEFNRDLPLKYPPKEK